MKSTSLILIQTLFQELGCYLRSLVAMATSQVLLETQLIRMYMLEGTGTRFLLLLMLIFITTVLVLLQLTQLLDQNLSRTSTSTATCCSQS